MREFLSADYWNERYLNNASHWDLGVVSPPLKTYIDQLADKNSSILIPGAGNSYEAVYLMEQGFTNITVIDIAPIVIQVLQEKYPNQKSIQFIETDFFNHRANFLLCPRPSFEEQLRKAYGQLIKAKWKISWAFI